MIFRRAQNDKRLFTRYKAAQTATRTLENEQRKRYQRTIQFSSVQQLVIIKDNKKNDGVIIDQIFKRFFQICNGRDVDVSYDMEEYSAK